MQIEAILRRWIEECQLVDDEPASCLAENQRGYQCTRRKGHVGKHHAHGGYGDDICYAMWGRTK